MAGSVDYSIKPQFDPGYRPQTLLHPLLHKQAQSPQSMLCGFVTEKERERRASLKSSKVQLKPRCCYTCYTSSGKQAATQGEGSHRAREQGQKKRDRGEINKRNTKWREEESVI